MYQVFNMGPEWKFTCLRNMLENLEISKFDVDAQIVGRVEASAEKVNNK